MRGLAVFVTLSIFVPLALTQQAAANATPLVDNITLTPANPRTNGVLQATVIAHDPDGDPITVTYQWERNGVPVAGATASTYDLSQPAAGDKGNFITVRVTASDGQLTGIGSASVVVEDTPAIVSLELSSPAPRTNDWLAADVIVTDPDSEGWRCILTYFVNDVEVSTVAGCSHIYILSWRDLGDKGDVIVVNATVTDVYGAWQAFASATAVVADSEPLVRVTLNESTPATVDTLVATATGGDPDGDPVMWTYDWSVNGELRQTTTTAATTDSFNLALVGNGDRGDVVAVTVIGTDGTLSSRPAVAEAAVIDTPPEISAGLSDTSPTPKDVLIATTTASDVDDDPLTFTYTWQVGKRVVQTTTTTATSNAFSLAGRVNNGDVVTLVVTASDGTLSSGGAGATATVTANKNR